MPVKFMPREVHGVSILGDTQDMNGHSPRQLAVADPAWVGWGWTRDLERSFWSSM